MNKNKQFYICLSEDELPAVRVANKLTAIKHLNPALNLGYLTL